MAENKKPGPAPRELSNDEKDEFLRLRRSGLGFHQTIARMGIGPDRVRRARRDDPEFRRNLEAAEDYLIEALVALRMRAAIQDGDADAQVFLINRHDRGRQFAATMRQRRREAGRPSVDPESRPQIVIPAIAPFDEGGQPVEGGV